MTLIKILLLLILLLVIALLLSAAKAYSLWLKVDELNSDLEKAVLLLRAREKDVKKLSTPDDQVTKLIKLAISSSSEGEARNAAIQACKRLAKNLK